MDIYVSKIEIIMFFFKTHLNFFKNSHIYLILRFEPLILQHLIFIIEFEKLKIWKKKYLQKKCLLLFLLWLWGIFVRVSTILINYAFPADFQHWESADFCDLHKNNWPTRTNFFKITLSYLQLWNKNIISIG